MGERCFRALKAKLLDIYKAVNHIDRSTTMHRVQMISNLDRDAGTVLRYSIRLSQVTDPCAEPKFGLRHSVTWPSAGGPEGSQND